MNEDFFNSIIVNDNILSNLKLDEIQISSILFTQMLCVTR